MQVTIQEYPNIEVRCRELGIPIPIGACILPRHFSDARSVITLLHESTSLDLKVAFRNANLPITLYQPDQVVIPHVQENYDTWIGPVLFFSAAVLNDQPELLKTILDVISSHVAELFNGLSHWGHVKLSIVIESVSTKSTSKTTKRLEYDGPADKLSELISAIRGEEK